MKNANIQQIVTFKIEKEMYGLPVMDVSEIIFPTDMQSIATNVKHVVGVVVLRGQVISILDFRVLLKKDPLALTKKQRIIILSNHEQMVGLLVDEVAQVMPIVDIEIDTAPKSSLPYVFGICKNDQKKSIIYMLETDALAKEIEGEVHEE